MIKNGEIIGYSRFKSKKGNEVMYANIAVNLTERDRNFGHVGMRVEQVWIPSSCFHKFNDSVVGKILNAKYDGFGQHAEIVDVNFI